MSLTITSRATVVIALVVVVVILMAGTPATAGGGWGQVDCDKDPSNPQCVIQVGTPDAPGSKGTNESKPCRDPMNRVVPCYLDTAGSLSDDGCYYKLATGDDLATAIALVGEPTPPGQWYLGVCGYPPIVGYTRFRVFGTPPSAELLAAQAVKALRLPVPAIQVSPAPPTPQIVFLPSWVWLNDDSWGPRSATASVPGMRVTATAKPVKLVLSTGDGAEVTCTGRGTQWTAGSDATAPSPTCGHTFSRAGSYPVRVRVTWNVSWAGGGQTGAAPAMTTTAELNVRVVEEQIVNSGQAG